MTKGFVPIEEGVRAWTKAWSARDTESLLALWDAEDDAATYLPAERSAPLTDVDAIRAYADDLCGLFDVVRHRPEQILSRQISPSTGLAFYTLSWMVKDRRGPIGGTCRVTSVWRSRKGAWRCCHYAEAPLAPLLELQGFYEAIARDGVDHILRRPSHS